MLIKSMFYPNAVANILSDKKYILQEFWEANPCKQSWHLFELQFRHNSLHLPFQKFNPYIL
ncbi:hypothetical protein LOK49_LG09G01033 [Camellia lanceoleosa]|uniref:Uncharacterized protein n=1 Tax=Camellia lanceoleosa TaxID=1840588 RepID=A0ACC0GM97_9ERIC|nr:hypothetical protein LOK49_LG09G01033 [Camellia lanceoleosa]